MQIPLALFTMMRSRRFDCVAFLAPSHSFLESFCFRAFRSLHDDFFNPSFSSRVKSAGFVVGPPDCADEEVEPYRFLLAQWSGIEMVEEEL